MSAVEAVLLDALGTLVRFEDPAPRLVGRLRERHGVALDEEAARAALVAEIGVYRAEHHRAVDETSLAALRDRCAEVLFAQLPAHVAEAVPASRDRRDLLVDAFAFVAFPEALEVLRELRQRGLRLAVVSNWDVSLHEVLDATGVAPLVDVVVASALVGERKPGAAPFVAALDALDVEAGATLHAGDALVEDVEGALGAGLRAAWVDRLGAAQAPPAGVARVPDLRGLLALA